MGKIRQKATGGEIMKKQQIKIDMKETTTFICPKCKGNLFDIKHKIFKVSKLSQSNPTGKDVFMPVIVFKCAIKKCGYLVKEIVSS